MPQPTLSIGALSLGDSDLLYQALTDALARCGRAGGDGDGSSQLARMQAARANLMIHRPLDEAQRAATRSALARYVSVTPIEADVARIVLLLESAWDA